MPNVTRAALIAIVTNERDAGFTYDADLYARVVHAIETVNLDDVRNADLDDIDETTCDDATLAALTLDFHFGLGWDLIDA